MVRYTGFCNVPLEERQRRFVKCCKEGHTELAFVTTGINLPLVFNPCSKSYDEGCDFEREEGKVHISSRFIMNGVCVRWRGWLDLRRLSGTGCLEYDEEQAQVEQSILKARFQVYTRRLKELQDKQQACYLRQETP